MRIVPDTNLVVSGLLFGGKPARVLKTCESRLTFAFTSPELLAELLKTLRKPKLQTRISALNTTPQQLALDYLRATTIVALSVIPAVITADPDDDKVLATAVTAGADAIVTGDQHLLSLGQYQGIEIMTAAQLLNKLGLP